MIVARSPLRISFGGGGTDLPAYYERHGGLVLSTSIQPACHVRIEPYLGPDIVIRSLDFRCTITLPCEQPLTKTEPLSLPRAVIAWFEALDRRPMGLRITMRADVPPGSGLGSSSAMTAALVAGIARQSGMSLTRREIAEIACEVELDILRRPIGQQDQYACAIGGINIFTFSRDGVEIAPARLRPAVEQSLEEHLVLMSTRQTRDSASVLRSQRDASAADSAVIDRLHRIKHLALAMNDALDGGDLPGFGALLDQCWQLKRGLSGGVTSPAIDRWYEIARSHGAYGGKIAGAGGGGHFIFCVPPARRARMISALELEGLTHLSAPFDRRGCQVHGTLPTSRPSPRRFTKGDAYELARSIPSR